MICGPALSSLPHPPHTRAISHSPLPAYQPATTSHHGLNTSKLSTTSSTLSSTFILDYQHHPRQQVVTPHRASVITLETAGPTFQIFTHLSLGTRHYTLAVIIRRRNQGVDTSNVSSSSNVPSAYSLCGLMQDSHAEASSILQGDKALTKRAGRQRIPIYLLSSSNNTTTTSSHHYYYELMVMAFE